MPFAQPAESALDCRSDVVWFGRGHIVIANRGAEGANRADVIRLDA